MSRVKKNDILEKSVKDIFFNGLIEQVVLDPQAFIDVVSNIEKYKLDFDDAYQLTVSQKYDMTIITFDKNFNHEGIAKMTPEEVLKNYE